MSAGLAAVRGRIEAVESGVHAAQVVGKAAARRVEVEEAGPLRAVVVEAVDDVGRNGDERAGGRRDALKVGADAEGQLALEHVEGVRVLTVDVGLGAAFPALVARPRHVEQLVREEDAKGAPGLVDDGLALAGRGV